MRNFQRGGAMLCAAAVTILMLSLASTASATTIYYGPTQTGTTVNGTTWSTSFEVQGHVFASTEFLAIIFPYADYLNDIADHTPADPNWSVQIFEPDLVLGLPTDGEVDFIPSADGVSAPDFFLSYTYLAADPYPAPQDWQIVDSNTFLPLESGQTVVLPEPSTPLMLGGGLALAWILRKRRWQPSL